MNYFELFKIPVQLKVNNATLPRKYFALSRKYHPDYFVNNDPKAQAEALEKSATLNKAFKTFQNPDETIKYVLQLKGLLEEEEKYVLPPDFLMAIMDINEQVATAKIENDPLLITNCKLAIETLQSEIYEPVKEIVEHYQEGITPEKRLLQVKEYYYKKKYLQRINQQLAGKS